MNDVIGRGFLDVTDVFGGYLLSKDCQAQMTEMKPLKLVWLTCETYPC